ncbi:DUF4157 domain-containing protein [uncultured Tenacibaculum sp.]|uniref:eCIS core domain-containing protein n=1 Tax=uncultured Tenacibaculum sp. TaxID=174713 RepID=UPI00262F0205|nr:DUF4157 domain-containing protein [uncultured Tenacibaculum sp.]
MFIRDKKPKTQIPNKAKEDKNMFFQPKLTMGKSGDKYEVEADKMADKVVNKKGDTGLLQKKGEEEVQQKPLASEITPFVQKKEGAEEEVQQKAQEEEQPVQKMEEEEAVQAMEEEEAVQSKKCGDCKEEKKVQKMEEEEAVQQKEEEEESLQAKENSNNKKSSSSFLEGRLRRGNGGQQMDTQTSAEMESGFGADFSRVRIHNDSEAAHMSAGIGAQAFTHGNDIYFNKGKYNPNSKEGKTLLAHELTHTIQQTGMIQKQASASGGFDSTITMRHQYFESRRFEVTNGSVAVFCNAQWDRGATHCGNADYKIGLMEVGTLYDSDHGLKRFSVRRPTRKTWTGLSNGTYFLTFNVESTNHNCILQGDVRVRT